MVRYRSLRTIGHGVDGPVEEVLPDRLDAEPLARRPVGVPPGPARRRLRETCEALARVGHPAIATVVDVVDVDDGRVDVVRTLGTDGTLADRVAAGSFLPEHAETIIATLADALRAAHAAGVAHGHVTASNVLCRGGAVLLADFGVTAARTEAAPPDAFARDLDDLADLAHALRAAGGHRLGNEPARPGPPIVGGPAPTPGTAGTGPSLPHWTERPGAPAPAASAASAAPRAADRVLAGALAFGVGGAMGVTFVLVETLTGRA